MSLSPIAMWSCSPLDARSDEGYVIVSCRRSKSVGREEEDPGLLENLKVELNTPVSFEVVL